MGTGSIREMDTSKNKMGTYKHTNVETHSKEMNISDSAPTKPTLKGFTTYHLNGKTFKEILKGFNQEAILLSWDRIAISTDGGILANIETEDNRQETRIIGHIAFRLHYKIKDQTEHLHKDIVLKSKARGYEVLNMLIDMQQDSYVKELWIKNIEKLGLSNLEWRELECIRLTSSVITSIIPEIYWHWIDENNDIFVFAMEYLEETKFTHLETINNVDLWTESDILTVLTGVADMHAMYYNRTSQLLANITKWFPPICKESIMSSLDVWKAMLKHNHQHIPEIWDDDTYALIKMAHRNVDQIYTIIESSPLTLIHNDFKPCNICLHQNDSGNKLCVYDWEVSTLGPPQHDLAEFLIFTLPTETSTLTWHHYVKLYFQFFHKGLQSVNPNCRKPEFDEFQKVFDMCIFDLLMNRLITYGPTYRIYKFPFLKRVVSAAVQYLLSVKHNYSFLQ